jgi:hypothetical protein
MPKGGPVSATATIPASSPAERDARPDRNLTTAASSLRLWLAALTDDYDESVAQVSMRAIAELLSAAVETSKDPGFVVLHAKNLALTVEQALWEASSGKPRPALDDLRNVTEHVLSLAEQVLSGAATAGLKVAPKASEVAHA